MKHANAKCLLNFVIVNLFMISAMSCAGSSAGFDTVESDKDRIESSNIDEAQLNQLVADNTDFAFDMYHQLNYEEDNLFFCPHSISLALAMTCAGANGETADQIKQALRFTLPQEELHSAFNALDLALTERDADNKKLDLEILNSLWGQKDYPFLSSFLDTLALYYGAGFNTLDFVGDPEGSCAIINEWVSDCTEGRIQEAIPPGQLDNIATLVITNAVYFKAAWKYPFNEKLTRDAAFNLLDGSEIMVPMMYLSGNQHCDTGDTYEEPMLNYTQGDDYQVLELPYDGDLSMVFLLPDEGMFVDVESRLDGEMVRGMLEDLQSTKVHKVSVPKFSSEPDRLRLKEILSELGMPSAFIAGVADFSGIDGTRDLWIDDVYHKTYISIDEEGTEASASTVVVLTKYSLRDSLAITLDRPFIYMIQDMETNAILFVGRIMDPSL
ncbi:MAG: serpin family protein [Chloroflexota bacterium]|nr:serpin family protein [Chloroflexota bacterium]